MQESRTEINAYLLRSARGGAERALGEIRTREAWEQVREQRREEMREMLGLLPWPARTPLLAQTTGKIEQGSYRIEKVAFQSLPKFYVSANLYLPAGGGRHPAVVYACGHQGMPGGAKVTYQRHGISLAKNGYVAIVLDPIQEAEAFSFHHGVRFDEMYDWYSRGYTAGGVEAWNAIRAIDYLETRPEVDKTRIGMTGFSGGAMATYYTAAIEPRVKVAAPFMGLTTYAAILRQDTMRRHCDCMFPVNLHAHDMLHLAALIAPRPLLMGQGVKDTLFPEEGYKECARGLEGLYAAYQRPEAFRLFESPTGHEDTTHNRETAIRWFDRHLMGVPERKLDLDHKDLPGEALRVFPAGAPAGAQNFRVHEMLIPAPPVRRYTSLKAWEARRDELVKTLRSKVLRKAAEKPRGARLEAAPASPGLPARFEELRVVSDDGPPLRAFLRRSNPGRTLLLHIASDGDGLDTLSVLTASGRRIPHSGPCLVMFPRGVDEVPWSKAFWRATLRHAMLIGETVDSLRLHDVLRTVEALYATPEIAPSGIAISGQGTAGALGLYAAILDARIRQVILIDPPSSHAESPIFLHVLRHTDLPEAAALIAPRPLQFYMKMPEAYEHTRHVYQLYGQPQGVSRIFRVRYTESMSDMQPAGLRQ